MTERTTVVDQVLNIVGFIIIAISVFAAVFILIRTVESSHSLLDGSYLGNTLVLGAILYALGTVVIGTVTGCLFIGFGTIIHLLDQIRWQGEMALNNDKRQPHPH
jgi:hypothetical protein